MKKFYIQLPSENKDPKGLLKKYLVEKILGRSPWLSFAGIDAPSVSRGVQYAGPKDYIVFDPSAEFDVNWATYDDLAESTKISLHIICMITLLQQLRNLSVTLVRNIRSSVSRITILNISDSL